MQASVDPRPPRRSTGEWLFQLTTITVGVLIALSFDAVLKWNADRSLVNQARATIALEIADNRKELEAHLATYAQRAAKLDAVLRLMDELDAGVEPTVREVELGVSFPSLGSTGWETAEQTGALALMDYPEVQRLAGIYALQGLLDDNLRTALSAVTSAATIFTSTDNPYALPPARREDLRARVLEVRGKLFLDDQLGRKLLESYSSQASGTAAGTG